MAWMWQENLCRYSNKCGNILSASKLYFYIEEQGMVVVVLSVDHSESVC